MLDKQIVELKLKAGDDLYLFFKHMMQDFYLTDIFTNSDETLYIYPYSVSLTERNSVCLFDAIASNMLYLPYSESNNYINFFNKSYLFLAKFNKALDEWIDRIKWEFTFLFDPFFSSYHYFDFDFCFNVFSEIFKQETFYAYSVFNYNFSFLGGLVIDDCSDISEYIEDLNLKPSQKYLGEIMNDILSYRLMDSEETYKNYIEWRDNELKEGRKIYYICSKEG